MSPIRRVGSIEPLEMLNVCTPAVRNKMKAPGPRQISPRTSNPQKTGRCGRAATIPRYFEARSSRCLRAVSCAHSSSAKIECEAIAASKSAFARSIAPAFSYNRPRAVRAEL